MLWSSLKTSEKVTVLIFHFFLCSSFAVDLVNAKLTAFFVTPKSVLFEYPKAFREIPKDYFQLRSVTHESWGIKNKNDAKVYFILVRNDVYNLINEEYNPLKETDYIQKIYEARFSSVRKMNSIELPNFLQNNPKFFVIYSPEFNIEYDSIAFTYKSTGIPFIHINGTYSIQMIDTRYNISIKKRFQETISEFVKNHINKIHIPNMDSIYIVTDTKMEEALSIKDYVTSKYTFSTYIYSWKNFEELRQICKVSPSELSIFYVTFEMEKPKVFMFPDEDVYSNELLQFFISKAYTKDFEPTQFKVTLPTNENVNMIYDISMRVPSKDQYVIVYFKSKNSYDNLDATLLIYDIAKLGFGPNVSFYMTDPSLVKMPWFVPTLDDFPTIVMWKPDDFRPFIYSDIFTFERIEKWIRNMIK